MHSQVIYITFKIIIIKNQQTYYKEYKIIYQYIV